jgi:hypothetical protein
MIPSFVLSLMVLTPTNPDAVQVPPPYVKSLLDEAEKIKVQLDSQSVSALPYKMTIDQSPLVKAGDPSTKAKAKIRTLKEALIAWGKQEEWRLVWQNEVPEILIPAELNLERNYSKLIKQLELLFPADSGIFATLFEGDRVLYVHLKIHP